jgi:Pentapeptide repeats (8 copies)
MTLEPGMLALAVVAALLLGIAIWWLWWRWPQQQVDQQISDPKARADVEDNFRKTVGQALGGAAVLIGAFIAYLQFSQQQRSSHDLMISTQVSNGFAQLGSKEVVVRLGGIYALEGVMNNSDQYYRPVLEALAAFIREGTSAHAGPTPTPTPLPTDIQAALTVIGRRLPGDGVVDLTKVDITGAHLNGAHLSGAHLSEVQLNDARLFDADLTSAILADANMTGANLEYADLTNANLVRANLSGAHLSDTNLSTAHLSGAHLNGAHLINANLSGADLTGADLRAANLTKANLTGARLDGQQQLAEACGSDAALPAGLALKPCPSESSR